MIVSILIFFVSEEFVEKWIYLVEAVASDFIYRM